MVLVDQVLQDWFWLALLIAAFAFLWFRLPGKRTLVQTRKARLSEMTRPLLKGRPPHVRRKTA